MIHLMEPAEWRAFDERYPAPTFFARPAWALALSAAYPQLSSHPVLVELRDGKRLVIPLVSAAGGRLRWRELIGMPLGTYTCAMREHDGTPASAMEYSEALRILRRECDILACTPWPFAPRPSVRGGAERQHETAAIDLTGGLEAALRGFDSNSRRNAGQAERKGVVCRPHYSGMAAATYYEMLRAAAERWGKNRPSFPKALLDELLVAGGNDVEIWLAEHVGHPIAGGIVLYGANEAFFWSAAMRHEYARMRPSNALNVAIVSEAARRGMRWYNLGASEGLPGVERFKRGLGAVTYTYSTLRFERTSYALYSLIRSSLPERRTAHRVANGGV